MNNGKIYLLVPKGFLKDLRILFISILIFFLIDSHFAPGICLIITALVFIRRLTLNMNAERVSLVETDIVSIQKLQIPENVEVFEMSDEFSVMALLKFLETIHSMQLHPKILIIRMRFLRTIDESGIHAFKEIREQLNHNNTQLLLSSVNPYMQQLLENTRIVEKWERKTFFLILITH